MARDEFELDGAVAVVTGATRGIGKQAAWALGQAGARVVIVGRTSASAPNPDLPGTVEDVADELRTAGIDALPVQANLVDPDATEKIVEKTQQRYERCDVLVNNAAYTSNGPIMEVPWRRWQNAFRVQVVAPLQLCQAFVPGMLERGRGRVVNISSSASRSDMRNLSLYSVSKRAMERWSDYMNFEVGGRGVSFNTLRVDRIVATEGWYYVAQTQGMEIATGGLGVASVLTVEVAGAHIAWMVRQPVDWSGNTVGFQDITRLGGPPSPPGTDAIAWPGSG